MTTVTKRINILLFVGMLPIFILALLMPRLIEQLGQHVLDRHGIAPVAFTVSHFGLNRTRATAVRLGMEHNPWLRIGSVEARYSPTDLLHRKIDEISINDPVLTFHRQAGIWSTDGLSMSPSPSGRANQDPSPWHIGQLNVNRSWISIHRDDHQRQFLLTMRAFDLVLGNQWAGHASVTTRLGGRTIKATAHLTSENRNMNLQVASADDSDPLLLRDLQAFIDMDMACSTWSGTVDFCSNVVRSARVESEWYWSVPDQLASITATYARTSSHQELDVNMKVPSFAYDSFETKGAEVSLRTGWVLNDNQELTGTLCAEDLQIGAIGAESAKIRVTGTWDDIRMNGECGINLWGHTQPMSMSGTLRHTLGQDVSFDLQASTTFESGTRLEIPSSPTLGPLFLEGTAAMSIRQTHPDPTPWIDLDVQLMTVKLPVHQLVINRFSTVSRWKANRFPESLASLQAAATTLQLGELHMSNVVCRYQIRENKGLFLERIEADWCGGRIDVHALWISPDQPKLELLIHCSHLNVKELLQQFGISIAQLDGTMSGRLPVTWHNGKLRFSDGFLHTTPGDQGRLCVKKTDLLGQVLAGNPDQARLSLALAALRSFDYDWIKLNVASEDDTLLLGMQVLGKPSEAIPYAFNRKTGSYEHVQGKGRSGSMPPIQFDLNFSVPLDDILRYTMKTKDFLE